jgi:hypothetical protein
MASSRSVRGEGVEDLDAGVDRAALLKPRVPGDANPGELCQFLAPQARRATADAGRKADVLRADPFPAGCAGTRRARCGGLAMGAAVVLAGTAVLTGRSRVMSPGHPSGMAGRRPARWYQYQDNQALGTSIRSSVMLRCHDRSHRKRPLKPSTSQSGLVAASGRPGSGPGRRPGGRAVPVRRWCSPSCSPARSWPIIDTNIVNVAVPSMHASLGASGAGLQLIVAGYTIAYAVLLVTGARLGDILGHRRMYPRRDGAVHPGLARLRPRADDRRAHRAAVYPGGRAPRR